MRLSVKRVTVSVLVSTSAASAARRAEPVGGVAQVPAVQTAFWMQGSLAVQLVPSGSGVVTQPAVASQAACAQGPGSGQVTGALWHCPATKVSTVQALPSLQSASVMQQPGCAVWTHCPSWASQRSVVQALWSLQSSGPPSVHVPLWQVCIATQTLASEPHRVPLGTGVTMQSLLASSQVADAQSVASCVQFGPPPTHTPPWQWSLIVQKRPSSQSVPSVAAACWQTPATHVSTVQALPSLQSACVAHRWQPAIAVCWQTPPLHVSAVQGSPSSQLSCAHSTCE